MIDQIVKYPRTRHIEGSRKQAGDEDLDFISFKEIKGFYVVLEEKVDGANAGISFNEEGRLLLQSRGHFLDGGYGERQFNLFKVWANCHKTELYTILGSRYVMYGEWLYAKHTVFYDALTHYFMEFDIYDKEKKEFLSTKRRREMLQGYSFVTQVRVLFEGRLNSLEELTSWLGKSSFKTDHCLKTLEQECRKLGLDPELAISQTDNTDLMEGIYIKVEGLPLNRLPKSISEIRTEEEKEQKEFSGRTVLERCKYVRSTFLNTIMDSGTHWLNRPLIPNLLREGVNLFASEDTSSEKE